MKDISKSVLQMTGTLDSAKRVKNSFKRSKRKIRKLLLERFADSEKTLIYVHIGKCGGSTLQRSIKESPILKSAYKRILRVHLEKPIVHKHSHYLVVIRNPIQRAISAFNFQYHRLVTVGHHKTYFAGEYELLRHYGTLNNLAEALYRDDELCVKAASDFENIYHLHHRVSYYLNDLLSVIRPDQMRFVMSQETLNSDIEKLLQVKNTHNVNTYGEKIDASRKRLSTAAYANLKRYLSADYLALKQLLSICNTSNASEESLLK